MADQDAPDRDEAAADDERLRLRAELYALHARFCQAFGDPKRLLIIAALRDGELTVGQLAGAIGARQANVSQHLALMRHLGLVEARRAGTSACYRLTDRRIVAVVDLLRSIQADLERRRSAPLLSADAARPVS